MGSDKNRAQAEDGRIEQVTIVRVQSDIETQGSIAIYAAKRELRHCAATLRGMSFPWVADKVAQAYALLNEADNQFRDELAARETAPE